MLQVLLITREKINYAIDGKMSKIRIWSLFTGDIVITDAEMHLWIETFNRIKHEYGSILFLGIMISGMF
jgi:translation initiation factor IF-1